MSSMMLREKSSRIRHDIIKNYNIIKIPVMYDDTLTIYNIEKIDIDSLEKLINEVRDNNLSDKIILDKVFDYDSYIKYIKAIIGKYKISLYQEKIKNSIVKFQAEVYKLPGFYIIFKELFGFGEEKSLGNLSSYLSDLKNGVSLNNNSPLQVEIDNSDSILNAIREMFDYIEIKSIENYQINQCTGIIENELYDEETIKTLIDVGKINKSCIESGIFEFLKLENKIKIKLDS